MRYAPRTQQRYTRSVNDTEHRAAERLRTYEGSIVRPGTPKPRLRDESFTMERLEEMWALCVAQWTASGREMPSIERSQMPGEIFRIER